MEEALSQEQQILTAIVQALSEGTPPEEIAKALVEQGVPEEQVTQFIQAGVQYIQEQSGTQQQVQEPVNQLKYGGLHKFLPKAQMGRNKFAPYTEEENISYDPNTISTSILDNPDNSNRNFYDEEVPFQTSVNIATGIPNRGIPYETQGEPNPTFFTNEDVQNMMTAPYPEKIANVIPKLPPPSNTGKDKTWFEDEKPEGYVKLPEGEDYESKKKKRTEEDAKKDTYGATPHGDWRFNPIPADRPWLNILQGAANMMQGTQRGMKDIRKAFQDGGTFEPHMMIHPSSNKSIYVLTENDHNEYANKGYLPQDRYKWGGFKLDPAKKGTFKAQATRMGVDMDEAADRILSAPEGKYSPEMRKKANFYKNFAKELGGLHKAQFGDIGNFDMQNALSNVPTAGGFDYLNSIDFTKFNQQNTPVTPAPVWSGVQDTPVTKTYPQSGASFKDPMAVNDNYVEPEEGPWWTVDPFKPKPEEDDVVIPGSERQQGEPNPLALPANAQPDPEVKRQLDEEDAYVKQRAKKEAEKKAKSDSYMSPGDQILVGFNTFNTGLEARKEKRNRPELLSRARAYGNTVNDSDYYASNDAIFGQKTVNRGLGTDIFGSQHQYASYGKFGGLSKFINGGGFNYKDGDEVIMSKEELDRYIQMGGQVEILDDLTKPKY